MRIEQLLLPVTDIAATARYFQDTLQLGVTDADVRVGTTRISLREAPRHVSGAVHLAFNVPDNRFAAAAAWLRERTPLQCSPEGRDYFALESSWQSQSVYFTGPDGLILELIGRRRLPDSAQQGPFHGSELTCVSEVGLPVSDVPSTQRALTQTFGLQPLSDPSDAFAPMGDDDGLLIVVNAQRRWFPEQKDLPGAHGIEVLIDGGYPGAVVQDPMHGWSVRSR